MTWTNPTTRSTGDLITAAIWNQDVVDNGQYLYDNPLGEAGSPGFYDSSWFSVTTATAYTKAHGLGATPRLIVLLHSAVAAPGAGDEIKVVTVVRNSADLAKGATGADATNVYAQTENSSTAGVISSSRGNSVSGYYRILAWK